MQQSVFSANLYRSRLILFRTHRVAEKEPSQQHTRLYPINHIPRIIFHKAVYARLVPTYKKAKLPSRKGNAKPDNVFCFNLYSDCVVVCHVVCLRETFYYSFPVLELYSDIIMLCR
jgi:hypothetical protein